MIPLRRRMELLREAWIGWDEFHRRIPFARRWKRVVRAILGR